MRSSPVRSTHAGNFLGLAAPGERAIPAQQVQTLVVAGGVGDTADRVKIGAVRGERYIARRRVPDRSAPTALTKPVIASRPRHLTAGGGACVVATTPDHLAPDPSPASWWGILSVSNA